MGPSLASLCPDGCRGLSADPAADLAALTAKLRAAPLRGAWYDRARPPPRRHAAADRDRGPALRRRLQPGVPRRRADGGAGGARQRRRRRRCCGCWPRRARTRCRFAPRDFSAARYAAVCEETPLPWPRGTPLADRFAVARDRALALPATAFAPFDAEVAYADEIDLCLRWPDPGRPPARGRRRVSGGAGAAAAGAGGPAHAAGGLGARRDAAPRRAAGRRARRRARGHRRRPSGCGRRQLLRFVAGDGRARALPARADRRAARRAVPPASFEALAPAAGLSGARGEDGGARRRDARLPRLRALARARRRRARRRAARRQLPLRPRPAAARRRRRPGRGRERARDAARARWRCASSGAAAARGRVRVTRRGRLTGRLGGRRVAARLANRPPQPFGFAARAYARATLVRPGQRAPPYRGVDGGIRRQRRYQRRSAGASPGGRPRGPARPTGSRSTCPRSGRRPPARRRAPRGPRRSARRRPPRRSPPGTQRRLVPGIGTTSSPCACTQASATCAGVASLSAASASIRSTIATFASRLSPCRRGWKRRKSSSASWSSERSLPVRKPRPSGL